MKFNETFKEFVAQRCEDILVTDKNYVQQEEQQMEESYLNTIAREICYKQGMKDALKMFDRGECDFLEGMDDVIARRCRNMLKANKEYKALEKQTTDADVLQALAEEICYKQGLRVGLIAFSSMELTTISWNDKELERKDDKK